MASSSKSLFSKNHPRRAAAMTQPLPPPQQQQPLSTHASSSSSSTTTFKKFSQQQQQQPPQLELVSQPQQQQQLYHRQEQSFQQQREYLAPSPSMANATVVSNVLQEPLSSSSSRENQHHYLYSRKGNSGSKKKKKSSLHKMMKMTNHTMDDARIPDDARSSASTTAVTQQRQEQQRRLLTKVLQQSTQQQQSTHQHNATSTTARSATSAGASSLFSNPQEQRAFLSRLLQMDSFQKDMNPSSQATSNKHSVHLDANNNTSNNNNNTMTHDDQKKKLRRLLQQKLQGKKEAGATETAASLLHTHPIDSKRSSSSSHDSSGSGSESSGALTITNVTASQSKDTTATASSSKKDTTSIDIASAKKRIQKIQQLRQDAVSTETSQPRLDQHGNRETPAATATRQRVPAVTTVTSASSSDLSDAQRKQRKHQAKATTSSGNIKNLEMIVTATASYQLPPVLQPDSTAAASSKQPQLPPMHPNVRVIPPSSSNTTPAITATSSSVSSNGSSNNIWAIGTTSTDTGLMIQPSDSSPINHSTTNGSGNSRNYHIINNHNKSFLATTTIVDPGFAEFLHSLQKEVSNDHGELWNSFQGVFMGHDGDRVSRPLKSSTRHKLDTKAKEWLTSMNLHLKRSSVVECVKEAQLVNDKRVAKEVAAAAAASHALRPALVEVNEQDTARIPQPVEMARPHLVVDNKENQQESSPPSAVVDYLGHGDVQPTSTKWQGKDDGNVPLLVERPETVAENDGDNHYETAPSVVISPHGATTAVTFRPPDMSRAACDSTVTSTVVSQSPDTTTLDARSSSGSNNSEDSLNLQPWKQSQQLPPAPLPPPRQADAFAIAQFAKLQVDRLHSLLDQHQQQEHQQQPTLESHNDLPVLNKPKLAHSNQRRKDSASKTTVMTLKMALNKQKASLAGTKRRLLVDTVISLAHPPPPGPSWSEVKLKRPPTATADVGTTEAPAGGVPWQAVKLRSVTKKEQATLTPLRPVSRWLSKSLADTEDEDDEDEHDGQALTYIDSDIEMTNRSSAAKALFQDQPLQQPSESASSIMSNTDLQITKDPPPLPFNFPSSSSILSEYEPEGRDDGLGVGQTIELDMLPHMLAEVGSAKKTFVIDLAPHGSETATVVVVGKGIIMTLQPLQRSSQHQIAWSSLRTRVETVTLDLTSQRVELTLNQAKNLGSKSLFFNSAEDCLKFANSFYGAETHDSVTDKDGEPAFQSWRRGSKSDDKPDASPIVQRDLSQSLTESLSEEEQKVIELFRQMRRTKGKDVAMQETIREVGVSPPPRYLTKSLSSPSFEPPKHIPIPPPVSNSELVNILRERLAKQGVTSEATTETNPVQGDSNESIAEKYLKMLKVSIPLDAVKHKMTQEQVSEDIQQRVVAQWEQLCAQTVDGRVNSVASEAPSNGLTSEEEKIADSYRKMLKMRVPPEAVRHKMTKEQVDPKIVMIVLDSDIQFAEPQPTNEESIAQKQSDISDEDEAIASVYRKMLKMMVPAEAVRHRMVKDQVDDRIVTFVLGGGNSSAGEKGLTSDEEKIAEIYRRMLKLMIPAEAVRHRMRKDQVDEKIVLVVLGSDASSSFLKPGKQTTQILSDEDEAIAETYRKMLKFRIPKEAVGHRMKKEGVSPNIISAVLGDEANTSEAKGAPPGTKLVSLHWTPLSGDELDNSIWRANKKRKVTPAKPEGKDISKLIQLFQKKDNNKSSKGGASTRDPGQSDKAKLIDLNRANNVAISLKAFKDFTHIQLAEIISHLDPMRKIGAERVHFIKDLLPTAPEVKAVKEYDGPGSKLVPAELWFRQIVTVQRLESKVQVMRTMETFESDANAIIRSFRTLGSVCQQVMTSEKLQDLLEMILQIGNIMNEGTRTGGAAGFKFDSLLKLTQTKSSDGKTTVLDYLVTIFVAKGQRETLLLSSDFPECQTASRMNLSDLLADARTMGASLIECKKELDSIRKEESAKRVEEFIKRKTDVGMHDTKSEAAAGPGIFGIFAADSDQLLDSVRSKNVAHETQSEAVVAMNPSTLKQREKFLAALRAKKEEVRSRTDEGFASPQSKQLTRASVDDDCDHANAETKPPTANKTALLQNSLWGGVRRLENFIATAERIVANLEIEREEALQSCVNLSKYCGESGGERASASLLGVLSEFAVLLDQAVKKHDEKVEAEARRAAFEKKRQVHSPRKDPPSSTRKSKKSLVLAVNELLKEASDQTKDDFTKGVVYQNPDKKLQEIYELERQTAIFVPSPKPAAAARIPQEDILSAIKKRRQRSDMLRLQHSVSSSAMSSVASSDVFAATSSAVTEVTSNLTYHPQDDNDEEGTRNTPLKVHIRPVVGSSSMESADPNNNHFAASSGMNTPRQPEGMYSTMCCIYR